MRITMSPRIFRPIAAPIRDGLTWHETWCGSDAGLIFCWENGRRLRCRDCELSRRASVGELVTLPWKGGTENIDDALAEENRGKAQKRYGTLYYLATWQGLRGEDLNIDMGAEQAVVCSRSNRAVLFRGRSRPG